MSGEPTDEEFQAELERFVGLEIGPPQEAPDDVNRAMIRHWCEAMGDTNPIYVDDAAAAASRHGGLVAPPTMLQAWVMHGVEGPHHDPAGPYHQMNELLFARGFTSVVATNSEQTYHRYLRPGDSLTLRTVIDSISPQKQTALGTGHFVTTRQDYYDAAGELVGSMLFRIIRFRPAAPAAPAALSAPSAPNAAPEAPAPGAAPRPRPATTYDNQWWFDALGEGRLLIQRCAGCGRLRHPAGPMCPACRSLRWDTVQAAGGGTIHSFVVTHSPQVPGFDYPLPIVLVDLDEGVRMVMNTAATAATADIADIAIGRRVTVSVRPVDADMSLPFATIVDVAGSDR